MELIHNENGIDTKATLLKNLEEIRSDNSKQHDMLFYITTQSDIDSLELYVELGLDLNVRCYNLTTMMNYLENSTVEFVEHYLELGGNINAINLLWENGLISLTRKKANPNVQKLLISKGLNPYERDSDGRNCFHYSAARDSLLEILNNTHHTSEEPTFEELISKGFYDIALNSIYSKVENLGGLKKLLGMTRIEPIHIILAKLQKAFMYKNMVKEASALFTLILEANKIDYRLFNSYPLSFVPSLLEGDMETVFTFIERLLDFNSNQERESTYFIVLGHMIAQKFGNKEQQFLFKKRLMNKNVRNNYYTKWVLDILRAQTSKQLEDALKYVESHIGNYHISAHSEVRFLQSFYYVMIDDYVSAEIMYRDIVQFSMNNNKNHYDKCAPAFLMANYLKDKISIFA